MFDNGLAPHRRLGHPRRPRLRATHRPAQDIIKSGGEWISLVDLENVLHEHPDIRYVECISGPTGTQMTHHGNLCCAKPLMPKSLTCVDRRCRAVRIDAAYRLREKNPGLNYGPWKTGDGIGGTWDPVWPIRVSAATRHLHAQLPGIRGRVTR